MFAIYPGFEDLTLRVEVEWRGSKRMVVARLEQWPGASYAVLSCTREDTGSKYFVSNGKAFYQLSAPQRWLCRYVAYDIHSRKPQNKTKFNTRGEDKFRSIVQRAFRENNANWGVIRLVQLPELPKKPRVVAEFPENLCWCLNPLWPNFMPFRLEPAPTELDLEENIAQQQILDAWNDESSDAYLAWNWATLSKEDKRRQIAGFDGDWNELEHIMKLIMQSSTSLWQLDNEWSWWFSLSNGSGYLDSSNGREDEGTSLLECWREVLCAYFRPKWREEWLIKHLCVNEFWKEFGIFGDVFVKNATAHEQIEAKLALREWLRDKATPAVAASLLASLES